MSLAVLLAAAAGGCAAVAVAEWMGAPLCPPARAKCPKRSHLAGMTVLIARLARRAGFKAAPRDLEARLAAAGSPLGLTAGDIVALKGAGALGVLLFVFTWAGALPGRLGTVALLAAPVAGFFTPELVLRRVTRARGAAIADELADVLDLLRVAVAAGLPVGRAMGEVGHRMHGVLAAELDGAAVRLQLGEPRAEVLAELVVRCPAPAVATLAAAIVRADRHGSPLEPALHALAREARADQARRLHDAAAKAAPKIQLVVALVLVPAVMLLVGAVLAHGLSGPR